MKYKQNGVPGLPEPLRFVKSPLGALLRFVKRPLTPALSRPPPRSEARKPALIDNRGGGLQANRRYRFEFCQMRP